MTTTTQNITQVDELRLLEAEGVHIIREVVAELQKPVLLFSAGKDSIVLLRLAEKAFRPSPLPFPCRPCVFRTSRSPVTRTRRPSGERRR